MAVTTTDSIEYIESQLEKTEKLYAGLVREVERLDELRIHWHKRLEEVQETA